MKRLSLTARLAIVGALAALSARWARARRRNGAGREGEGRGRQPRRISGGRHVRLLPLGFDLDRGRLEAPGVDRQPEVVLLQRRCGFWRRPGPAVVHHQEPRTHFRQRRGLHRRGLRGAGHRANLRYFGAHHSFKFSGKGLAVLKNCKNVVSLEFGGAAFDDDGLRVVAEFDWLQELVVGGTRVTSATFPNLAKLVNLRKLVLAPVSIPISRALTSFIWPRWSISRIS